MGNHGKTVFHAFGGLTALFFVLVYFDVFGDPGLLFFLFAPFAAFLVLWLIGGIVLRHLHRRVKTLRADMEQLRCQDQLTGLPNRACGLPLLMNELSRSARYKIPFSLALFDIDGLKALNEFAGREIGDCAIRETAAFVAASIRDVDRLFSLGSGQFALLLPCTDLSGAFILCERLRGRLEQAVFTHQGRELAVTVSFGVIQADPEVDSMDTLLDRAEALLFRAKGSGRNRVC
jgi:diguanylate cyclase (GGDEF)-like protein